MSYDVQVPRSKAEAFAPHPGRIVNHFLWNNTEKVLVAAEVPDEIKFVYYDEAGAETSDRASAKYRVPVVEITTATFAKDGTPVAPEHAAQFVITSYGPQHRELKRTMAAGSGK